MSLDPARTAGQLNLQFKDLKVFLDAVPAMIWIWDTNQQCSYVSPRWLDYRGVTCEAESVVGFLKDIYPGDAPLAGEVFRRALDSCQSCESEFRIKTSSGQYRWVRVAASPFFSEGREFQGYVGTCADIHEARLVSDFVRGDLKSLRENYLAFIEKAQKEHLESEAHFYRVLQHIPVMLCALDGNGRIVMWNKECERSSGYEAGEVLGDRQALQRLFPNYFDQKSLGGLYLAQNRDFEGWESPLVCKDGKIRIVDWTSVSETVPIRAWDGGWCVGIDVTEQRELEKAMLSANSEGQIAKIGRELHDHVCQDLVGIRFQSENLIENIRETPAGDKTVALAERIHQRAEKVLEVTRNLARGLLNLDVEILSLEDSLERLVISTQETFGVSCRLDIDVSIPIRNPEFQLHFYRIAQEAVSNAIRHAAPQIIALSLTQTEDLIILEAYNDGKPMPDGTYSPKSQGLRLMQYRMKVLGGLFEMNSKPEGGTLIRCSVPRKI